MSYSDIERQREYQREWLRNKSRQKRETTVNLASGFVTWQQLQELNSIIDVKTWNECITKAKTFIYGRQTNRLAIAELAVKACKIRRGGDFRSEQFKKGVYGKTIKDFADELNMNSKTLQTWIRIKILILDKFSKKDLQGFDWTKASISLRKSYYSKKAPLDEFNQMTKNNLQKYHVIRYLSSVVYSIRKYEMKDWEKEDKNRAIEYLKEINSYFNL